MYYAQEPPPPLLTEPELVLIKLTRYMGFLLLIFVPSSPLGIEMDPMMPLHATPVPGQVQYMTTPTYPTPLPIASLRYPIAVPGNAPGPHCGLDLSQTMNTRDQVVSFLSASLVYAGN